MAPPAPLTARHLNRATRFRQGLIGPITGSATGAVARVGSLQAQHAMAAAALAARAADRKAEAERVLGLVAPGAGDRPVELASQEA